MAWVPHVRMFASFEFNQCKLHNDTGEWHRHQQKKSILGMCVSVYVCQHRFIEQNERCSLNAAPFSVFLRIFSCALCIPVGKARSGNFEFQFPPLSRFVGKTSPLSSNIQTTRNKCENWVEDSRKEDTFK